MLTDTVKDTERLYRAVKRSRPGWLDYGKPTSAMFRDSNGVSVDRDGERDEDDIIDAQKTNFGKRLKGVTKVGAKNCYDVGATIEAAPSEDNIYHANIWLDLTDKKKEMLQAYMIAQAAEIVYIDDSVEWTSGV